MKAADNTGNFTIQEMEPTINEVILLLQRMGTELAELRDEGGRLKYHSRFGIVACFLAYMMAERLYNEWQAALKSYQRQSAAMNKGIRHETPATHDARTQVDAPGGGYQRVSRRLARPALNDSGPEGETAASVAPASALPILARRSPPARGTRHQPVAIPRPQMHAMAVGPDPRTPTPGAPGPARLMPLGGVHGRRRAIAGDPNPGAAVSTGTRHQTPADRDSPPADGRHGRRPRSRSPDVWRVRPRVISPPTRVDAPWVGWAHQI